MEKARVSSLRRSISPLVGRAAKGSFISNRAVSPPVGTYEQPAKIGVKQPEKPTSSFGTADTFRFPDHWYAEGPLANDYFMTLGSETVYARKGTPSNHSVNSVRRLHISNDSKVPPGATPDLQGAALLRRSTMHPTRSASVLSMQSTAATTISQSSGRTSQVRQRLKRSDSSFSLKRSAKSRSSTVSWEKSLPFDQDETASRGSPMVRESTAPAYLQASIGRGEFPQDVRLLSAAQRPHTESVRPHAETNRWSTASDGNNNNTNNNKHHNNNQNQKGGGAALYFTPYARTRKEQHASVVVSSMLEGAAYFERLARAERMDSVFGEVEDRPASGSGGEEVDGSGEAFGKGIACMLVHSGHESLIPLVKKVAGIAANANIAPIDVISMNEEVKRDVDAATLAQLKKDGLCLISASRPLLTQHIGRNVLGEQRKDGLCLISASRPLLTQHISTNYNIGSIILVVDPTPTFSAALCQGLQRMGYNVIVACTRPEACRYVTNAVAAAYEEPRMQPKGQSMANPKFMATFQPRKDSQRPSTRASNNSKNSGPPERGPSRMQSKRFANSTRGVLVEDESGEVFFVQ